MRFRVKTDLCEEVNKHPQVPQSLHLRRRRLDYFQRSVRLLRKSLAWHLHRRRRLGQSMQMGYFLELVKQYSMVMTSFFASQPVTRVLAAQRRSSIFNL